jgi:hypothetical protein
MIAVAYSVPREHGRDAIYIARLSKSSKGCAQRKAYAAAQRASLHVGYEIALPWRNERERQRERQRKVHTLHVADNERNGDIVLADTWHARAHPSCR